MSKPRAEGSQARQVKQFLRRFPELSHLRVRRRADLLTLESGPTRDPFPHARLRRDTVHLWRLEMATHTGRWVSGVNYFCRLATTILAGCRSR